MAFTDVVAASNALYAESKAYINRQRKPKVALFLTDPEEVGPTGHAYGQNGNGRNGNGQKGNGSVPIFEQTKTILHKFKREQVNPLFNGQSREIADEVAAIASSLVGEIQVAYQLGVTSLGENVKPLLNGHSQGLGEEISAAASAVYNEMHNAYQMLAREGFSSLQGSDLRRQHLSELATGEVPKISKAEEEANRNLVVSVSAMGAALAGTLLFPPLLYLTAPAILYTMVPVFKKSYKMLIKGQVGVDTLSAITITGCLFLQYFMVGATLTLVYTASRKLLLKVQDDSRKSLIDVFRQQPRTVWVLVDGTEVELPFEQLKLGDIVVVDAGMTIPADGRIVDGIASVDQHVLTGEAQPAEKSVGDEVFASTIVLSGRIRFEVEQAGATTTAAKIGEMLNNTADFKTHTQLRAEKMADKTVMPTLLLGVLSIPIVGAYGALAILNSHFKYRLGIVAPIGILNFLNLASHNGILVKDGRTLDLLNQVDTIVFDKTGTLTKEVPHIGAVYAYNGYEEDKILTLAAAAENRQTHPIARAIIQEARKRRLTLPGIDEAEYKLGYGLTVRIEDQLVQVGSARFMVMADIEVPETLIEIQERCHEQGHSLVMVAVDSQLIGAIELRPTLRPEVKEVIAQLRGRPNIKTMYIISGDHDTPTRLLAHELGIDHYFAETLPENKADIIGQLQEEGKFVCYIGDGINDSIALKKSQVSVSLRGASTAATDTAQVVLMDESLKQLPVLFDIAHEFDANMRAGYMCLLVPTIIGISGVFLLQFGLVQTMILTTAGLSAGLVNAMLPWYRHKREITGEQIEKQNEKRLASLSVEPEHKTEMP